MESYKLTTAESFDISKAFILGRKAYDIGVRVVKWNELRGYDGYKRPLRIKPRPNGVDDIKQLLIHHAGQDRRDPGTMYKVLWDQRKLSVHFALDEFLYPSDGLMSGPIIWQFCDCDYITRHAGSMNKTSIGIEVCHFPAAWKDPHYYSDQKNEKKNNLPHKVIEQPVYSKTRKVYAFTNGVTDALARLYAGCWVALGEQRTARNTGHFGLPPYFPRVDGEIPYGVITQPILHKGLIAHRHCSKKKWDPAGLDFYWFENLVTEYFHSFRQNILRVR